MKPGTKVELPAKTLGRRHTLGPAGYSVLRLGPGGPLVEPGTKVELPAKALG
ncbi:hypothetical protein [Streptomyces curacoi]|uniref:hypothetical protein n=1 Tax=Streptomyces curacoi TaxID=146536 RepID=UPI000A46EB58|nr:hypothetical protein [Streptomyces curacoi]